MATQVFLKFHSDTALTDFLNASQALRLGEEVDLVNSKVSYRANVFDAHYQEIKALAQQFGADISAR